MATFANFVDTLTSDGKQFEHFVKWFLRNDPEWSTQVDQIWLWDEYPNRWGRDCGVDLVFKHKNGDIWAVQAKCYSPQYSVTKHDIDKFLSESNRASIDKRLLIATTDLIGANARQVCDAQEKQVVRYMLWDFEQAEVEYPATLSDLSRAKRKDPPTPRDYQQVAIKDVVDGFQSADRGQLIMACGTGKTFASLWIKEKLNAKNVLVLLPSLSLLSQTLKEWTFAANKSFDVLCVCSDKTVAKRGADEAISSVSDVAFPVKSDIQDIIEFLRGDADKVIFSTYQSSPLIAEAQKNKTLPDFDIVFADEAHRCAGKPDGLFSTVLDQKLIRVNKRLFMTATPRTYSTRVKKSAEGRGVDIVDMDDEKTFGKVFHSLSFGEAISRTPPLLTDYRVVIIGVDDAMIAEWIKRREIVESESGLTTDAESLAAQIGFLKAIRDYDITRAISFHSRVNRAKIFSEDIQVTIKDLDEVHRPKGAIWADYVSGEMPTGRRRQKLDRLKTLGEETIGLLSNARCLSEGVDVPALDGVAFIDPRRSQVDIIQAVGRAIRLSKDKTAGTIVLPVFIENSEDAEQTIESSRFKPIWGVLNALKAHDDVLSEQLDQIRTNLGRHTGSIVDQTDLSKIVIDLPMSVSATFADSLRTQLVEQTTESWEFWYGLLMNYAEQEGNARVPGLYKASGEYALGSWVGFQRQSKDSLNPERKHRLESLKGWVWNLNITKWEEGFAALQNYVDDFGHAMVPQKYKLANGYLLGSWVSHQRITEDSLNPERKHRLESIEGWIWNQEQAWWEEGFVALQQYVDAMGNARIPKGYESDNDYPLGGWASTQRQNNKLSPERKKRLNSLGFVWNLFDATWEEGFRELEEYVQQTGNCVVPTEYITPNGFALGSWSSKQRSRKTLIATERKQQLDTLGFIWNKIDAQWEEGFAALQQYVKKTGDTKVPYKYETTDGYPLGSWVNKQKIQKEKLAPERKKRLNSLGFIWSVRDAQWEEKFKALQEYVGEYGHARVIDSYETPNGINLGRWVETQRLRKSKLTSDRRKRLEALSGWVWKVKS